MVHRLQTWWKLSECEAQHVTHVETGIRQILDLYCEKNTWKRRTIAKLLHCFRKFGSLNLIAMSELLLYPHVRYIFDQKPIDARWLPRYSFRKKIAKSSLIQLRLAQLCWNLIHWCIKDPGSLWKYWNYTLVHIGLVTTGATSSGLQVAVHPIATIF